MPTLVAIGYPDQRTAEQAWETVRQLEDELVIQADAALAQHGGTVIKTTLSEEDTKTLKEALQPWSWRCCWRPPMPPSGRRS